MAQMPLKKLGGGGEKTEGRSEHDGNLKFYRNKWLCKVLFHDTNHKNRRIAASTGSKSHLAQYLASEDGQ